jgi:hypothetical protein
VELARFTTLTKHGAMRNAASIALVTLVFVGCGPLLRAEDVAALRSDMATVQSEIKAAETEDARYAGGLVKTLIAARIAILRQTEAMLQQRLKSSVFGISIRFTIDGKPFYPPASAKELLLGVEQETAVNLAKIKLQEAETARYSGGLVQAISHSTLATLRQTQAMLDQKRLSLKYGLPQYVGFTKQAEPQTNSPVISPPVVSPPPVVSLPKTLSSSPAAKDWEIVAVGTRVTESNSVWSKYAWKLTIRNNSDRPQLFTGTIEFQDADGFIVDTSAARHMAVPARSEDVFTGYTLVRAEVAGKIARTVAKIGVER